MGKSWASLSNFMGCLTPFPLHVPTLRMLIYFLYHSFYLIIIILNTTRTFKQISSAAITRQDYFDDKNYLDIIYKKMVLFCSEASSHRSRENLGEVTIALPRGMSFEKKITSPIILLFLF